MVTHWLSSDAPHSQYWPWNVSLTLAHKLTHTHTLLTCTPYTPHTPPPVTHTHTAPSVADSPGLFRVQTDPDSETGAVFIDMPVDYELVQSYRLTLSVENVASGVGPQCQSSSECTFSQTAILEVAIGDENDNAPVFTRDSYTGGE